DGNRALGSIHVELTSHRHHMERHGHFDVQVVFLAVERGVGRHVHDDVEIAARSSEHAVFTLAVQAQALAVGDAGRNTYGHPAVLRGAAGAATRLAGVADDAPGARTLSAGARHDEEPLL